MDLISPNRTTSILARGNALAFALSFVVVLAGMTLATRTTTWVIVMTMACLIFGWLLTATLVTHVTSDVNLACEDPIVRSELHAMTSIPVIVRLENLSTRWTLPFLTAELIVDQGGLLLNSPPKFVGQLPVRSSAEFEWRISTTQRGSYTIRGIVTRTTFPGSMFTRESSYAFDKEISVLPVSYRLSPKVAQLLSGRRRAAGHRPLNSAAAEEFVGVREYRAGDNPRNISLSLSMRMPDYPWQLVVREFEDPSDDEVCVVLDTTVITSESDTGALGCYRLEKAISFSIALCRQLCELKHRVRFVAAQDAGQSIDMRINYSARDIPALERKLARLAPTSDRQASRRLIEKQAEQSSSILLYVSLEDAKSGLRVPDWVQWITPEWQASLVTEVGA